MKLSGFEIIQDLMSDHKLCGKPNGNFLPKERLPISQVPSFLY